MDTRLLYILAVVIATVSGGYYYYSGKSTKLAANAAHSMTQSADGIQVLQTDDQGALSLRAQVDHAEQNIQNKTSKFIHLNASMYRDNQVNSTFSAKQGLGFNDNAKMILSGDVQATQQGQHGEMVFNTDELTFYRDTRLLETKLPVQIDSPNGQFVSQGLKADLNQGQYEFFNIQVKVICFERTLTPQEN